MMVTVTTDVDLCWALNPGLLEEEGTKELVRRAISLAPNVTSFLSVYLFMCVQVVHMNVDAVACGGRAPPQVCFFDTIYVVY